MSESDRGPVAGPSAGSPVAFRVLASGLGVGIGCGVGVGVGTPLQLHGIPFLGQVAAGVSQGVGAVTGGAGRGAVIELRRMLKTVTRGGADAGLGCGVGLGYGFGVGFMVKPAAMQKVQEAASRVKEAACSRFVALIAPEGHPKAMRPAPDEGGLEQKGTRRMLAQSMPGDGNAGFLASAPAASQASSSRGGEIRDSIDKTEGGCEASGSSPRPESRPAAELQVAREGEADDREAELQEQQAELQRLRQHVSDLEKALCSLHPDHPVCQKVPPLAQPP